GLARVTITPHLAIARSRLIIAICLLDRIYQTPSQPAGSRLKTSDSEPISRNLIAAMMVRLFAPSFMRGPPSGRFNNWLDLSRLQEGSQGRAHSRSSPTLNPRLKPPNSKRLNSVLKRVE